MIHRNQLGSTSMLTGPAGQEESDFVFFPYGDLWKAGPAYEYHFAGFDFHGGWGWYGTNARPYHWDLGSWLSPDPTGGDVTNPQSLNRYAYVLNNPATLNDPSGLQPPQGLLWQQRRRTCAMDPICMYMWGQDPFFGLDALITGEGYSGGENGDIPDWNPGIFNGAALAELPTYATGFIGGIPDNPASLGPPPQTPTPQKPQKKPCTPLANNLQGTPAAGLDTLFDAFSRATHPLETLELNGIMFVTGGVTAATGLGAIAVTCFVPEPFEPLTCTAGVMGGAPTAAGGAFLMKQGVDFFKNYTLPAIKDWGCHE
jgi:RHS repeat-associated protein